MELGKDGDLIVGAATLINDQMKVELNDAVYAAVAAAVAAATVAAIVQDMTKFCTEASIMRDGQKKHGAVMTIFCHPEGF